jgi:hypothetical protein
MTTAATAREFERRALAAQVIGEIRSKLPPRKVRRRATISGAFLTERESMALAREMNSEFRSRFLYCPIVCHDGNCPRCERTSDA